jgi:transcriptional regulator with XRE-family HTH domain
MARYLVRSALAHGWSAPEIEEATGVSAARLSEIYLRKDRGEDAIESLAKIENLIGPTLRSLPDESLCESMFSRLKDKSQEMY